MILRVTFFEEVDNCFQNGQLLYNSAMTFPSAFDLHQEHAAFVIRPILVETAPDETHELPHRHDFQEILWIRAGQGQQAIDGELMSISANTFYLIAKGRVHQLITGIGLDGLVIRFTDDFLPDFPALAMGHYQTMLFNNVMLNHTLPVSAAEAAVFEQLLALMLAEYGEPKGSERDEVLRHLLTALLVKLQQVQKKWWRERATAVSPNTRLFYQFTLLLEKQFRQNHNVQTYAQTLGITPRQLSHLSRQMVGQTAKTVIENRVILEARRYLTFTTKSVKEIAFLLGYKDPSYFSKAFKRQTGISPQQYKQNKPNFRNSGK